MDFLYLAITLLILCHRLCQIWPH